MKLGGFLRFSFIFCTCFLLLFVSAVFFLSPLINQQQPRIERWLNQTFEHPIRINSIAIHWSAFSPVIEVTGLVSSVLKIDRMQVQLNVWESVRYWQLRPKKLFISGSELSIPQHTQKHFSLPNLQSGAIEIQSHNMRLKTGGIFREDILLDKWSGILHWKQQGDKLKVHVSSLQGHNSDLNFSGNGVFEIPADNSGLVIDLKVNMNLFQVKHKARYFPVSFLKPDLVAWLDRAIVDANSAKGTLILYGNLRDFPFDNPRKGQFTIDARVAGATFAYESEWPAIAHLDARLLVSGRRMEIIGETGNILDGQIKKATAVIPDLAATAPMIHITGTVEADSRTGFAFIQHSPLERTMGSDFKFFQLQGPMQLDLGLMIPLGDERPMQIKGLVSLRDNQLTIPALGATATQLQGQIAFTEKTQKAAGITAQFLGQPIRIDTHNSPDDPDIMVTSVTGTLEPQVLSEQIAPWIKNYISGKSTNYNLTFLFAMQDSNKNSKAIFVSDLKGVKIDLPAPFGKTVAESKPLHIQAALDFKKLLSVQINYNKQLKAELSYHKTDAALGNYQFTKGNFQFQSPEIEGRIVSAVQAGDPWKAVFKHIKLTEFLNDKTTAFSQLNPENIPAIDLTVAHFQYGRKQLGKLMLKLEPSQLEQIGLKIRTLALVSPSFNLTAHGFWKKVPEKGVFTTQLRGHIVSRDISKTLKMWDMPELVTGAYANLAFNLTWPDAPYNPTLSTLTGKMNLQMKNGRIRDISTRAAASMGFGHLLNVLSLQTLQRRLKFDFSDLKLSEFSFNAVQGQWDIAHGNAVFQDTQLTGLVARVTMQGRLGLTAKDYDLHLKIEPSITGSLPAVAAFLGGPVIGLAALTAHTVLGGAVRKIMVQRYHIQGHW